jgi:hypothetical protein
MKLDDIKIGSVIEIIIKRNGSSYRTVSKVEYADERFIGVTPIASEYGLFNFNDEDEVDLIYSVQDTYWKWERVKAGTARRKDGSRLHVFSATGNGIHFNRRTQYRFEIGEEIKMKYEVVKPKEEMPENKAGDIDDVFLMLDEQYEEIECRGYLKDLSEGGASVESDTRLNEGSFISFMIDSEIGQVFLRGVIIRVIEDKHGYFDYTYGVSFVETSKNYLQYFYLQQRKQLYEKKDK